MAIYRAQIAFPFDSAFPRDVVTINPHFIGDNAQAVADALKANMIASVHVGASLPFSIKIYDAKKAPPSYPIAQASNGTGFLTTDKPREVGLCLSFYSTFNRPSYRGRLYIPGAIIGGAQALRPTGSQRQAAGDWAAILGVGLPAQHTWAVYSRKLGVANTISDWFVDDEWDIQRKRGMRPTTRLTGKLP